MCERYDSPCRPAVKADRRLIEDVGRGPHGDDSRKRDSPRLSTRESKGRAVPQCSFDAQAFERLLGLGSRHLRTRPARKRPEGNIIEDGVGKEAPILFNLIFTIT